MNRLRPETFRIFVRQTARGVEGCPKIAGFQRREHLFREWIVLRRIHEFFRRRKLADQTIDRRVRRGGNAGGAASANDQGQEQRFHGGKARRNLEMENNIFRDSSLVVRPERE